MLSLKKAPVLTRLKLIKMKNKTSYIDFLEHSLCLIPDPNGNEYIRKRDTWVLLWTEVAFTILNQKPCV